MAESKTIEIGLYKDTVKIKFTEKPHSYWVDGKRAVGVTTVLDGTIPKPQLIPWAVNQTISYVMKNMDALKAGTDTNVNEILYGAKGAADEVKKVAGERGKAIHEWVDQFVKGKNPIMPDDTSDIRGVSSFLEWKDSVNFESIESEKIVYSKEHKYIGTLDGIALINGVRHLFDLKTGNATYAEHHLQTAAYLAAYCEEYGSPEMPRAILRVSKENEAEYNERMSKKYKDGFPPFAPFEFTIRSVEQQKKDFEAFVSALKLFTWAKENKI